MENDKNEENYQNILKFLDNVGKALEGQKDIYVQKTDDEKEKGQNPKESLDLFVNATKNVISEKYIETFKQKYDEQSFINELSNWINDYKEKPDFQTDIKILEKHLSFIRGFIDININSIDPLVQTDLTNELIEKFS
jgi:hypothetical protein